MQRTYQARYSDGASPIAYTVAVSFDEAGLQVVFYDRENQYHQLTWQKPLIREHQFTSGIVTLRYGNSPYQQLEVTDPDFIRAYDQHFRARNKQKLPRNKSHNTLGLVILGFIGVLLLAYFFVLPLVADLFARAFPKDYEIALGEKLYENVLAGEQVDTAKTRNINAFFSGLHVAGDYPVKITVVKEHIANAFALPGGGIVVYDRILEDMDSYEQLAALLAHEYSHIQLKHATRNIFRNLAGYLFISVLFSDVSSVAGIIIQHAEGLRSLRYSRSLEHEADENGLHILQENKIDAAGMKQLFINLEKETGANVPEYISSHPDMGSRIAFVTEFKAEHPYQPAQHDALRYYFNQLKHDY